MARNRPDPEAERRLEEEAARYALAVNCPDCRRLIYLNNAITCSDGKARCAACAEDFRQIVREEKRIHR